MFILSFFTLPLRHLTHGQVTTNEKTSWFLHACGLLSGDLVYYQAYGNVLSSGKLSVKSLPSYTLRDGRRVTLSSGKFDFWEPKASNWANSWLFSYLLRLICLSFFLIGMVGILGRFIIWFPYSFGPGLLLEDKQSLSVGRLINCHFIYLNARNLSLIWYLFEDFIRKTYPISFEYCRMKIYENQALKC